MIYFAQAVEGGPIKIGFSTDPKYRILGLNVAEGKKVRILGVMPGARKEEAGLHSRFALFRLRGEWFAPTEHLMKFIAENTSNYNGECESGSRKTTISVRLSETAHRMLGELAGDMEITRGKALEQAVRELRAHRPR